MRAYINGIGNISPQPTLDNDRFLEEVINNEGTSLACVEPDYKNYINRKYLRRMSRAIKMGVSAAKICLGEAQMDNPDAIIVGTGLGCVEDTERFLKAIYESNEEIISPTQFIQSTHNTLASQIAIMLGCDNYNFTYVHRGFSFESALLDALMQLSEEKTARNILVGGADESTESYLTITRRLREWKLDPFEQLDLLKNHFHGSLPGEGAAFFLLGDQPTEKSYAQLCGLRMLHKPKSEEVIDQALNALLEENKLNLDDIDLVLLGLNGRSKIDVAYHEAIERLFTNKRMGYFKHLCGEYKTATAFAVWLAAQILDKQQIPEVIKLNPFTPDKLQNILIYNNYSNINHSLLLLRHVES